MDPGELKAWLEASSAGLTSFCTDTVEPYLRGRENIGKHTPTDTVYKQFLVLAADIISGLEELREAAEKAGPQP
jgi:hypothetical protein